ncbi:hypothetical protein SCHPADRAFT_995999 [Schizopora paradoxa]|uniref:Uncharacterized protein n=1 Tax=Schizopora paradoxa TaxID=27342 RepID=A0A0H2S0H8_9AGAM|nr:hypothetical protein SCHPADRAFT_995999 [Schizopora paradoxa]
MSLMYKRQLPNSLPTGFTGSLTVTTNTLPSSLVIDNGATGSSLGTLAPSVTITYSTTENPTSSATDDASNATDTGVAVSSSASSSSISVGTVIGISVGVFVALAFALLLMFRLSANTRKLRALAQKKRRSTMVDGRNSRQDIERRKSGREMWMKMDDAEQREKVSKPKAAAAKSVYGDDATTVRGDDEADAKTYVERSVTVKSTKSTKTFKSIGYGVGLGLSNSFRTNEPPPQLEFTDHDMGTGAGFTRGAAPFARGTNPESWDGSTIADDSFLSLKHASAAYGVVSGNISPSIVQTHQTPPAIESKAHRWEEAEVVSPGGSEVYDDPSKPKHPYATASPVIVREPSSKAQNPFLDQNPFDDEPQSAYLHTPGGESSASMYSDFGSPPVTANDVQDRQQSALASLIAALNITPEEAKKRLSIAQSTPPHSAVSYASKYSDASGVSGIDKFPMPPPLPHNSHS